MEDGALGIPSPRFRNGNLRLLVFLPQMRENFKKQGEIHPVDLSEIYEDQCRAR